MSDAPAPGTFQHGLEERLLKVLLEAVQWEVGGPRPPALREALNEVVRYVMSPPQTCEVSEFPVVDELYAVQDTITHQVYGYATQAGCARLALDLNRAFADFVHNGGRLNRLP